MSLPFLVSTEEKLNLLFHREKKKAYTYESIICTDTYPLLCPCLNEEVFLPLSKARLFCCIYDPTPLDYLNPLQSGFHSQHITQIAFANELFVLNPPIFFFFFCLFYLI